MWSKNTTTKPPANLAVVLGLFETGLAVGRSLGRAGIPVLGLDSSKKVGFYSRYIQPQLCPHPSERECEFIDFLLEIGKRQNRRPVLFVTSDEFLITVSKNRQRLEDYYLLNLPEPAIIESIADKLRQYELCEKAGVAAPKTFVAQDMERLVQLKDDLPYPVFIKGREVNSWRKLMGVDRKGFVVNTPEELLDTFRLVFERGATGLIQEIIPGPDSNHFKACCYISRQGEVLLAFALQKIRQQPVRFGFGCVVQSICHPELLELGRKFLTAIDYRGVGSVEFKLDARTGEFKLIELNPRYWQQNGLAEKCGMNFPLIHFLDLTDCAPKPLVDYRYGIKWVNIYHDFESFRDYKKRGELSLKTWVQSLRGPKMYSDYARDDVHPWFHELASQRLFSRSLRYMFKKAI
jgi:predicted ATP-grasp superfamily ATP-dependent carboligase